MNTLLLNLIEEMLHEQALVQNGELWIEVD